MFAKTGPKPFPYWTTLLIFAFLICFGALESRELASGDETRVAGICAEMFFSGDYVTPKLNGQAFLEYPPGYYQLASLGFQLFGVHDFAAKLPSALAAFGSGIVLFALGLRLGMEKRAALIGSIILLSGAQFWQNGRNCMVDTLLAFCVLAAVYGFTLLVFEPRRRIVGFLLFAAGIGGGVFTKGLIGAVLPLAAAGSFCVFNDLLDRRLRFSRYLLLAAGAAVGLLPTALWCLLLYRHEGYDALHTVVWVNNFGRFSGSQGDHVEPAWYYLVKLPGLMQPFLLLALFGIWTAARQAWKHRSAQQLLLLCFLLVPLALLTISAGKRQVYLLPLYAPAALLAGNFAVMLWRWPRTLPVRKAFLRTLAGLLALAAAVFLFLAPGWNFLYPLAALVAGGAAFALCRRKQRAFVTVALAAYALFYVSLDAAILARSNPEESLRTLFARCAELERAGNKIILGYYGERTAGAAVYYLGHPIAQQIDDPAPQPGEYRIIRNKRSPIGEPFADSHYLLSPEEYRRMRENQKSNP